MNATQMKSNSQFVQRLRRNDQDAWGELLQRFQPRLLRIAKRLVGLDHAEDVVQDSLAGFVRMLPRVDPGQPLENLLSRIVHLRAVDHLRMAGRRRTVRLPDGDIIMARTQAPDVAVAESEEQGMQRAMLRRVVRNHLRTLRRYGLTNRATIVSAIFIHGRSNSDVAEATGMKNTRVATVRFETLSRLRAKLTISGD